MSFSIKEIFNLSKKYLTLFIDKVGLYNSSKDNVDVIASLLKLAMTFLTSFSSLSFSSMSHFRKSSCYAISTFSRESSRFSPDYER